jgi:hypothetical protein
MNASGGVVRDDKQKPDHDGGLEAASVGGLFRYRPSLSSPQARSTNDLVPRTPRRACRRASSKNLENNPMQRKALPCFDPLMPVLNLAVA